MKELNLPHLAPIRFAKYLISEEDDTKVVKVAFETIPSLSMLVESAAQSSAAFDDGSGRMGFLVTLKNIKLFEKPSALEYSVAVTSGQAIDSLTYFTFEIFDEDKLIVSGTYIIALN